ncbi:ThiF family adenylyltransferase [Natrinema soli]|uniref:ThiF family adenylyltransferase n=1 Tax=Natrinema soli TaxID=1930624 RepID=A0ABD5SI31_9EURY|nr:ThiF family adenylyltransferase [Natrinema soli]
MSGDDSTANGGDGTSTFGGNYTNDEDGEAVSDKTGTEDETRKSEPDRLTALHDCETVNATVGANEVHLSMTRERCRELRGILYPHPEHPHAELGERGVIGIIMPSTGRNRTTFILRELVIPDPEFEVGDRGDDDPCDIYEEGTGFDKRFWFDTSYRSRATDKAAALESDRAGLVYFHTHGPGVGVEPSQPDIDGAERDYRLHCRHFHDDSPMLKAIVSASSGTIDRTDEEAYLPEADQLRWHVRSFRPDEPDEPVRAGAVRVVGPRIEKHPTDILPDGPAGAGGKPQYAAQNSTEQLWGEPGQQILAGLRVGLVGCGGVGSILSEHIARLGAGEMVVADFDNIEYGNLNRAQGATETDARLERSKAEVAGALAMKSATVDDFEVRVIEGSVIEEDPEDAVIPALLDCDIIVNAADNAWARTVLDDLSYAHLIPVITGGTILRMDDSETLSQSAKSEVMVTGPGHVCMECAYVYNQDDVSTAMRPPDVRGDAAYVRGGVDLNDQSRAPSVIGANATVAGMIEYRLKGLALGVTERVVGVQRHFPRTGLMEWGPTDECKDSCGRAESDHLGIGDAFDLPTGTDPDLAYHRES